MMCIMKKFQNLIFVVIAIVILFPRFLYLNSVPFGISHDEVEYASNALSYFYRGQDLSGISFPRSIFVTFTEGYISPFLSLLLAPYYALFGLSQWSIRLPHVLLNLGTGLLIYYLVQRLLASTRSPDLNSAPYRQVVPLHLWPGAKFEVELLPLFVSLVFLLSPWATFYSRYAVEPPVALFFGLLGVYFLLGQTWRAFWLGLSSLIVMFFVYHATKLLLVPMLIVFFGWKFWYLHHSVIQKVSIALIVSTVLTVGYFSLASIIPDSTANVRGSDVLLWSSPEVAREVQIMKDRSVVFAPYLNNLFINRLTVGSYLIAQKYTTAFSTDVLFLRGDERAAYRFYEYGLFHIVMLPFLFLGALYAFLKMRKSFLLILGLLLISPLATALNTVETSVINRANFLLFCLSFLIGTGLFATYHYGKYYLKTHYVWYALIAIFLLPYSFFLHHYFFSHGIRFPDSAFTFNKVAAHYAIFHQQASPDRALELVHPIHRSLFLTWLLYSDRSTQQEFFQSDQLLRIDNPDPIYFQNLAFFNSCPATINSDASYLIHRDFLNCGINAYDAAIRDPRDTGEVYKAFQGTYCDKNDLSLWRAPSLFSDYQLDKMDAKKFCQRWVSLKND
jgi:hypothetical protein